MPTVPAQEFLFNPNWPQPVAGTALSTVDFGLTDTFQILHIPIRSCVWIIGILLITPLLLS